MLDLIGKVAGKVAGIDAAVTNTVGAMVDAFKGKKNGDLSLDTSKEIGNLCGSLGRVHKAAAESYEIASRIVDSQAGATSGQIPQVESVPPCRSDSEIPQEVWNRAYNVANNGPTDVAIVPSEPAESPEPEEVDRKSHSVIDGDSGAMVQSDNPLEVADNPGSIKTCNKIRLSEGQIDDLAALAGGYSNVEADLIAEIKERHQERLNDPEADRDESIATANAEYLCGLTEVTPEVKVNRKSHRPDQPIIVTGDNLYYNGFVELVPFHPGMDQNKGAAVATADVFIDRGEKSLPDAFDGDAELYSVELTFDRQAHDLKPGQYFARLRYGEKAAVVTEPFMVRASLRTLRSVEAKTGYSQSTLRKYIANGGIKPENVVGKSKTCNKIRLTEAAISDLVALGVLPHKKRRARLEKFLATHCV